MIYEITEDEIAIIARMHMEALPDDIIPMLGFSYLERMYSYLLKSTDEKIFINRDLSGEIKAVCVITFSADTLLGRIFKNTIIPLMISSIKLFLTSMKFNKLIFNLIKDCFKGHSLQMAYNPQIAFIFTNNQFTGNGFGSLLLHEIENFLLDNKFKELYTKTINNDSSKAMQFYIKNNFKTINTVLITKKEYSYMVKYLDV